MWMYTDLNSFDGIEKIYNLIEPLRGARKAWDIRPLEKRSKWWERIIKVDDNTYVLVDGWWASQYGRENICDADKQLVDIHLSHSSPIRWERRTDGDYVQIRSNINDSPSWSRYKFLGNYLPKSLRHRYDQSGHHWIEHNGQKHLLPKGVLKFSVDRQRKELTDIELVDRYVEFKHVGVNHFELTHGGYKKSSPIVDKEIAKHYKQAIRDLWDYARVVLPAYGYTLMDQQSEKYAVLGNRWDWNKSPEMIRAVLDDPETHAEKRLALCVVLALDIGAFEVRHIQVQLNNGGSYPRPDGAMFKEDEKSWDKFRRAMHRLGGMMTSKEIDFT